MKEHDKLIALAKLKCGVKPIDIPASTDISYSQALKLKKELEEAELTNTVHELVNMEEAAFEILLESVQRELNAPASELGLTRALEGELVTLSNSVKAAKVLEEELCIAGAALTRKIQQMAVSATTSDTILVLAEALSKIQSAFFAKGTNIQVNQTGTNFETFLRD
jgi:hypothetical protein